MLSTAEWKELYMAIDYNCDQIEKPDLAVPRDVCVLFASMFPPLFSPLLTQVPCSW